MEEKIINMNQFLGAAQGDQEHMLGKFLYFSLANLLVDKDELSSLCESMGIPYTGSTRLSLGDAFRSATGDIRERVPVTVDGETNIYLAYCRDNKRTAGVFSRELVKETLNRETNRYEKLANISCGKNDGMFRCDNLVLDDAVDVQGCCRKAEELFELYQRCANRKQIETICVNFLRGMEATKLSVTGHMYFVPRTFMERVDIFEDFITLLSGLNKKQTPLVVNSFYIIDDAKQRDKMTEEFYLAVKKEIAAYQEKCDYLIKSSSQSPAVMDRWVLKVQALEEKKRHYEGVLQRELDGLDDYIYLQQMRFDGRITVEKSIQVQPAAVLVPSFMLQPVVENAYSHGLKSREEGGRILLRAWMQGKVLVLTVADNGKGMTPEELDAVQTKIAQSEQTGRSIGLGNISRRIGMLYPGGKMQVYSRAGHGTVVRFELPQTQQPEEKEETLS